MLYPIFLLVAVGATLIGSICGIGGGILIKPVLDSLHIMSTASISFLSGCTVLSMTVVSVYKTVRNGNVKIRMDTGTPLAIGAAAGGVIGSKIFQYLEKCSQNPEMLGNIQAALMVGMMAVVILYTIFSSCLRSGHVQNKVVCMLLGGVLGMLSAFLGIGGGPLNLAVLSLFFSMNAKEAAANSLYIIFFSQSASLAITLFTGSVPEFLPLALALMVGGGLIGGALGSMLNKRLQVKQVRGLYLLACTGIFLLSLHNAGVF